MRRLLTAVIGIGFVSACGLMDLAEQTRDGVKETNELVHLQALAIACGELVTPHESLIQMSDSDRVIALSKLAKKCGESVATPLELTESAYGLLKAVRNQEYESNDFSDLQVEQRHVKYLALGCLAAYIPPDKFRQIITDQITRKGLYFVEAHELAAIRYKFIREFRLNPLIELQYRPEELLEFTQGEMEQVGFLYSELRALAQSPYRESFILDVGDNERQAGTGAVQDIRPRSNGDDFGWLEDFASLAGKIRTWTNEHLIKEFKNPQEQQNYEAAKSRLFGRLK